MAKSFSDSIEYNGINIIIVTKKLFPLNVSFCCTVTSHKLNYILLLHINSIKYFGYNTISSYSIGLINYE